MWKLRIIVALMSAVGAFAITSGAHAWGDMGHKTICEIAFNAVKAIAPGNHQSFG
jgi:hypothetical protein